MANAATLGANRKRRSLLAAVALGWAATSACGGSSTVQNERSHRTSGGTAGTRPSTGGGDVGRSGSGAGGSGALAGATGTAGSALRGGQGGTAGASCADERVAPSELCPVSGYDCPLTLDSLRRVDGICRNDGEDGYYTECDGYARFEWSVGFGENWYDLVFSTATGELVYGSANVYDSVCDVLTTTAGTRPPLGGCATCTFCQSLIDDTGGAGGEGGAGTGDRCAFDSDERVTLP